MTDLYKAGYLPFALLVVAAPRLARAQQVEPPPAAPSPSVAPAPTPAAPAPVPMRFDPPGRTIDLSTPPPSPSMPRAYHLHNGFYARVSAGFGSLSATFDDDVPSTQALKGSGGGLSMDLMIGGSPSPGVAIGGALLAEGSAAVEFERAGFKEDRSLTVAIVGPFIDGFPAPHRGWHLGGLLGFAHVAIEDSRNDGVSKTNGFGGAFWLGHDFWVADEWSVGPLLRFSGALTQGRERDVRASTFAVTLLFTGLYH